MPRAIASGPQWRVYRIRGAVECIDRVSRLAKQYCIGWTKVRKSKLAAPGLAGLLIR
jgi:hypothetical protein